MGNKNGHAGPNAHGHHAHSPMARPPIPHACKYARSYRAQQATVVEFHGAIDVSTARRVQVHVDAATTSQYAQVVVDLRPVEFFDCSALSLICRARRRAREREGQLALVCDRLWHLRILKAAGLHTLLDPFATVEDALNRERRARL
jgi:anti-sigma B factor antagonist